MLGSPPVSIAGPPRPGRVFDMIKRRSMRTRAIKLLILDEADEMLSKGFKEQIYDVYR